MEKPVETIVVKEIEKKEEVVVYKNVIQEVEREIQVPVEVIKYVEVEKPYEVIKYQDVERVVEKIVKEKEVVEVEKIVEIPVPYEKIVEMEVVKEVLVEVEKVQTVERVIEKPIESVKIQIEEKIVEVIKEVMVQVPKEVETDDCDCLTGIKFLDIWNKLFKIRGDVSSECLTERQFIEMLSMSFKANAKALMDEGNYTDRKGIYQDDNRETEHNSVASRSQVSKSQERLFSQGYKTHNSKFPKQISTSPFKVAKSAKKNNLVGF